MMFYVFKSTIRNRRKQKLSWYGTDLPHIFDEISPGVTPYKPGDIEYAYNEFGFRGDEFTEESEFPIIFLGCSHTEGTGLPLEDIWAYKLLQKIRSTTNFRIPFWNLGIIGTGIDHAAEIAYWFSKEIDVIPKMVISLFPPIARRISSYEKKIPTVWAPSPDRYNPEDEVLINPYYAKFQSKRSLMILEQTRALWKSPLIADTWIKEDEPLYKSFPNFNMVNDFPNEFQFSTRARDGMHFGPEMHDAIAESYWTVVKKFF